MPDPASFDWLISMGGPQSIGEMEKHPYLLMESKDKLLAHDYAPINQTIFQILDRCMLAVHGGS